jgi:hypothetical protein
MVTAGAIESYPDTRIFHATDGLVMAEIGTVCVALWRKKSTPERFKVQKRYLDEVVRAHPGEAAFLVVVEPGSEPPADQERRASSQMITDHGTKLRCVACVIEGSGLRSAITRSVLTGIVLVVKSPSSISYFDSPANAVPWMAKHVNLGRPVPSFIRQVEALRGLLPRD